MTGTARLFILLTIGVLAGAHVVLADSVEDAGRTLAQRVYDRPDGADASSRAHMILTEEGHAPRQRQMYVYRRDDQDGAVQSVFRFTTPPDIENTGLLTVDRPDQDTDQWIYLPALDRARRILSSRKGGRFVGSDLYYEDLRDRRVDKDEHRLLGTEKLSGVDTQVLESVPVDADNSVYGKRISFIHPGVLIPLRVDYFKPGEDMPSKRSIVHRIEKIQGYWTVIDSTMYDLESGHQTRIAVDEIVYDRDLPEELFSRQALVDPAREIQFRP